MPAAAPQIRPPASARPFEAPLPGGPRHGEEAPSRHLRVVDDERPRLRTLPTFVLGVTLAFAIAFAVVACQVWLAQGQQHLDTLESEITTQSGRQQQLRLEVAELEDPGRIVDAATELGLVTPPEVLYLTPAPAEEAGG